MRDFFLTTPSIAMISMGSDSISSCREGVCFFFLGLVRKSKLKDNLDDSKRN